MFSVFLAIFLIFTLVFASLAAAAVYHLREYSIPGHNLPRLVIAAFAFLSAAFWLFALYFLLKIRMLV